MKKSLLFIIAILFISLSSFAQTYPETVIADGENGNLTNVGTFWFGYSSPPSTILVNQKNPNGPDGIEMSIGGKTGNCISVSGVLENTGPDLYSSAGVGFALAPIETILIRNKANDAAFTADPTNPNKYPADSVSNSSEVAIDLSMAQGIKFQYKSTAAKLVLGVFTSNIKQNAGHDYQIELPQATNWTEFYVAFPGSELEGLGLPVLAQPSWLSTKTAWDGSKVFKLQWQVKDVDGPYSFSIDDVTIIGKGIANKVSLIAMWYALDQKIKEDGANALQSDIDKLEAAIVVINNPNATQFEVDSQFELLSGGSSTSSNLSYSITSPTEVAVKKDQYIGDIVIPNTVTLNGTTYNVTSIDESAFSGSSELTSISIPNSITSIGTNAFSNCTSLTTVTYNAINATNTGAAVFPSTVSTFTFGNEVETIPSALCSGLNKVSSITLPNSVKHIKNEAFFGTGITSITIPTSVDTIESGAFQQTPLESVTYNATNAVNTAYSIFPNSVSNFTIGNEVQTIPNYLCVGLNKLTSIELPNTVTTIGLSAFNATGITSISIPSSVTEIKDGAFQGNYNLETVIYEAINANYSSYAMFPNSVSTFTFGNEVQIIPQFLCAGLTKITSITLPNTVTTIGEAAFGGCSGITYLNIPNSVIEINDRAFENCTNLDSLTFETPLLKSTGSSLNTIGKLAFHNCTSIKNIKFLNPLSVIDNGAFASCTQLAEITLPNSITYIGDTAFANCNELQKITLLATTPPTISDNTFDNVNREIPLLIPLHAIEAYSTNSIWNSFTNLKSTDIISILQDNVEIKVVNGKLEITNPNNYKVTIYDIIGKQVQLNEAKKGTYIIHIGNLTQKIVL